MSAEREEVIVTLELEDGSTVDCLALMIFQAEDKEYIALIDKEEEENEEAEIFFYRYTEDENGDAVLESIEDDDEYEAADLAFDKALEKMNLEDAE